MIYSRKMFVFSERSEVLYIQLVKNGYVFTKFPKLSTHLHFQQKM